MRTKIHEHIKSKKRVADHGEVLTGEREVNAMLDLVHQETERVDSRFLEPACGTGNFLAPVLERKLAVVKKRYSKSQIEFEKYATIAVGSIYGIDLLEDNVEHCRERLFRIFDELYTSLYKEKCKDDLRAVISFILDRNIILGDALTLKKPHSTQEYIVFSEWALIKDGMIKRRDFMFAELAEFNPSQPTLFALREVSDTGEAVFSPRPIKEYPLTHFLALHL